MYALERFWINCTLVCVACIIFSSTAFTGAVFAQDDTHAKFANDLRQFTSAMYRNSVDETTLWGSAGSSWVLKKDSSSEISTHLDRFEWIGSKISFKTPFCNAEVERPRPLHLNGRIDFNQRNGSGSISVRGQRMIISTANGAASKSLKDNCLDISKISDFVDGRVSFKANIWGGEDIVTLDVIRPDGKKSIRLNYVPDLSFEPLARSSWKLRPDNGAPSKQCGLLGFSSGGRGSVGCCNFLGFGTKKVGNAWEVLPSFSQTLRACSGPTELHSNSDSLMTTALSKGLEINEEGNLIAGSETDTPYVFEPVTGFEKLEGEWLLSGLESRSFDDRIWTMPRTHRVKNEALIKDLNIVLTVAESQLEIKKGCRVIISNIHSLRPGYIRLGKSEFSDDNCEEKQYNRTTGQLLSVIGSGDKKGTVKVDYDAEAQTLILTRASIGSFSRSHSWIFYQK